MGELPQRTVVGVQQDRRDDPLAQLRSHPDVVVVGVGADDRLDLALPHDRHDRVHVVRRVDHDALAVVTDDPDVVVDLEGLTVEREGAGDDAVVDPGAARGSGAGHRTTTDRSTLCSPLPPCIFASAA